MHNGRCPVEVVSGVPVGAAPEEIDMISAPELRSALLEAAAHGHGTLVVDMTRTQFCDSSGVHTLLAAHECAQAEGGELLLVISATVVLRISGIIGFDRIVRSFPSLDEALAQTSADADGSSGHRRAEGAPAGSEHNRLAGGDSPPNEQHLAVARLGQRLLTELRAEPIAPGVGSRSERDCQAAGERGVVALGGGDGDVTRRGGRGCRLVPAQVAQRRKP